MPMPLTPRRNHRATRFRASRFAAKATLLAMASLGTALYAPVTAAEPAMTPTEPPFHGTIFIAPDIYLDTDPSAFDTLTYAGQAEREMFDRRLDRAATINAHLFDATFTDGLSLEVRVNPEFARDRAESVARRYLVALGQLPTELRRNLRTFTLHDGDQLFGGGGRDVLVHTVQGERYAEDGILTETLFHETVHATIDEHCKDDPRWLAAQEADPTYISTYARDHPAREDLAESLLLCIAMSQRPERLPDGMAKVLSEAIPHRLRFFDEQLGWNIDPTAPPMPDTPPESRESGTSTPTSSP